MAEPAPRWAEGIGKGRDALRVGIATGSLKKALKKRRSSWGRPSPSPGVLAMLRAGRKLCKSDPAVPLPQSIQQGWERGSQHPQQSIPEIRGRNCPSRGCAAPNAAGLPPPPNHQPPPLTEKKKKKNSLNPSFVFFNYLKFMPQSMEGPGAVYLHPLRYLFGNNIVFSLKQVLSPRCVPVLRVCVCFLPELLVYIS